MQQNLHPYFKMFQMLYTEALMFQIFLAETCVTLQLSIKKPYSVTVQVLQEIYNPHSTKTTEQSSKTVFYLCANLEIFLHRFQNGFQSFWIAPIMYSPHQ